MDPFESSPFPTAWPGTFAFIEERSAAEQSFLHASTFRDTQVSFEHLGVAERKRLQWESLKPLIQRLYIEEDKPFTYIVKIIREEYGFEPTKRQFLRKMNDWRFRKNVSRSERVKILEALATNSDGVVPDLKDWRLKPGKLKNWQRRYRGEVTWVSLPLSQRFLDQAACRLPKPFGFTETQIHQASDPGDNPNALSVHDYGNLVKESGAAPLEADLMEIFQDAWPLDWSTVDVLGSPGLSRLFKGLEIECATPIPPLSLDTPDYDDPTCLSSWEIQSLSNKCIKPVDRDLNQRSPRKTVVSVETSFTNQHPHYPWRDVNAVFCGYSPSPLNEVYIFPPSQSAFHKPLKPKATAWESLETEREKLELQFAKLRKVSNLENPAVTNVMKNLAQTYEHLGKLKKAELIFRQLVDVYRRTLGPQDTRTLRECLNVIICIMARDRNNIEALSLVQNLRSELFKLVPLDNPLALDAADVEACLAHNMGQMKKAESLDREILQMRLASEGPRHTETISALARFGKQISYRSTREGEIILRTALQLALEAPAVTDIKTCQIVKELAHCQHRNKTQVESYRTATKAVEKYIVSLGPKHMEFIKLRETLAWSTFFLGKITESEELFREVLSLLSNGEIEISGRILGSARLGLAHVLWKMDRIEEAADLYEKSFQTKLFYFPANHSTVVTTCYRLGACYKKLGRYDGALKLYHRFINKIRESDQDLKGEIKELESEILRIEQLREQSTSEKSDKESSEY